MLCPVKANEADFLDALRDMAPDLMVTAAYGGEHRDTGAHTTQCPVHPKSDTPRYTPIHPDTHTIGTRIHRAHVHQAKKTKPNKTKPNQTKPNKNQRMYGRWRLLRAATFYPKNSWIFRVWGRSTSTPRYYPPTEAPPPCRGRWRTGWTSRGRGVKIPQSTSPRHALVCAARLYLTQSTRYVIEAPH